MSGFWANLFDFATTADLLRRDFVQHALLASALLGLLAGVVGPLIVMRQMSFAVHGTSELSVMGAAGCLLISVPVGVGAIAGSVAAALLFGLLGGRSRERDSVIAVILAFGLGLSVLFLWLNTERTANKFGLLVGQVVSIDTSGLALLFTTAAAVLVALLLCYRPLMFTSADPEVAAARGVNVRLLSVVFAVLVGLAVAIGVQIVGALLVLSLLVTPAAAAALVTASPLRATLLAVLFAEVAAVGGIVLSLAPGVPVSVFVTAISFAIYLGCRVVARARATA